MCQSCFLERMNKEISGNQELGRRVNKLKPILIGLLCVTPSVAFAAQNGPTEVMLGVLGMIALAGFGIYFTHRSAQRAANPNNFGFSDADALVEKLAHHLDPDSVYILRVIRQSGNIERTVEGLSVNDVIKQVAQTMRRAKIDVVSIGGSPNHLKLFRTMHNGRGRQEGKRIGGFEVLRATNNTSGYGSVRQGLTNAANEIEAANNKPSLVDDDISTFQIHLHPMNEAQKAIVKAYFRIYKQLFSGDDTISEFYNGETGEGDGKWHYSTIINVLMVSDAYLSGTTDLTPELRKAFASSETAWQREIAKDFTRKKVTGAMAFGDTTPTEIKREMCRLWSECLEKDKSRFGLNSPSVLIPERRPKFLDERQEHYSLPERR